MSVREGLEIDISVFLTLFEVQVETLYNAVI